MNSKLFQDLIESFIEANKLAMEDLDEARKQFDSDSATFKLERANIIAQMRIADEIQRRVQELTLEECKRNIKNSDAA